MDQFIDVIKTAGPYGVIVLIFLAYIDRMDKRHTELVEKHMDKTANAVTGMTGVLQKLVGLINILGKTLKGKVIK
jgi:hypothetical protein